MKSGRNIIINGGEMFGFTSMTLGVGADTSLKFSSEKVVAKFKPKFEGPYRVLEEKKSPEREQQCQVQAGTVRGLEEQKEWIPDHPVKRLQTKGDQTGPEEEGINSTAPTIWIKDGQAVRILEAEEPNKNARK
ncbi:hypothetical protein TNCV_4511051 [Trichonephila clavipes]|nr:hypothetical protein TNCV_4511051 [Trichonephila clavipes]